MTPGDARAAGAQMVLGNTYHLALQPGSRRVAQLGGLQQFSGWNGPMLTDSGGFQVFSLADLTTMDERGVVFTTHLDGRARRFDPESVIRIQEDLGADIMMQLDVLLSASADRAQARAAADRTVRWAQRARVAQKRRDQWLFGIVQGGMFDDERIRAARDLVALDLPGYAIGGLSVGESPAMTTRLSELTASELPREKPRYLMGVGTPAQIVAYAGFGIDMFDCVLPTRLGRSGIVFRKWGKVNLLRGQLDDPSGPIDPECSCLACQQYSRAALRAMFQARTLLACRLASTHNVSHLCALMARTRAAMRDGNFAPLFREALSHIPSA
jgi:queuine tRNA-ribosyltransferase